MPRAVMYVSAYSLREALQLPTYLELRSLGLDPDNERLVLEFESPAIPEGTIELRPTYAVNSFSGVGENPVQTRRLLHIDLFAQEDFSPT